ncbi:sulfide-dependent adenosine diphosphate thiazole synthase [Candidatus Omnitrophota bacterium]
MKLDDIKISRAIIEGYYKKLLKSLDVDVAIAGGGPAGLVCGYYLAKKKINTVLFERKLSTGGGMWGGGMMFNEIVVQAKAKEIMDEFGIRTRKYEKGYFLSDSVEAVSTFTSKAVKSGVRIFNCISAEDVMIDRNSITGLVLNWSAVGIANLHVDPLTIRAKYCIDATGHAAEVCNIVVKKIGPVLKTKTGRLLGENPMWAERGEEYIVKNSKIVYPGLYVAGMAANAVFGGPRMGPVFGGMLLSGRKVAKEILKKI